MIFTMNKVQMEFDGKYLSSLRDSNELLSDRKALHQRMEEDGYLLIRSLHDIKNVQATRQFLLEKLHQNQQIDDAYPLLEGVAADGKRGMFMGGNKSVTHHPAFLNLVESKEIMEFYQHYFDSEVMTYDYKWLRVVGPESFTGAHYDIVYMGRGTQNVLTCWTPLGDIPLEMGPLTILAGSHHFEHMKKTYGQMDVDRDHVTGWFSNDPIELVNKHGGQWQTSSFEMGDVLIFSMFTMHASLDNTTNRFRLSTDTRYQRADEPVDERWVGKDPKAHYAWMKGETIPMEKMRKQWKV